MVWWTVLLATATAAVIGALVSIVTVRLDNVVFWKLIKLPELS